MVMHTQAQISAVARPRLVESPEIAPVFALLIPDLWGSRPYGTDRSSEIGGFSGLSIRQGPAPA